MHQFSMLHDRPEPDLRVQKCSYNHCPTIKALRPARAAIHRNDRPASRRPTIRRYYFGSN